MLLTVSKSFVHTHKKQQQIFFVSKLFLLSGVREKLLLMTVNNYGSIFVKIDRNVLMLNEFFALYAYALLDIADWSGEGSEGDEEKYEMNLMC